MDGSVVFARLRQCAPPPNTCFLGPTWVHTLNDISIGSAVLAHLTAEDPYTLQQAAPSPSKLPLLMGDLDSCLINAYLGPPRPLSISNGISISSAVFYSSLQSVPTVYTGPLIPPFKIAPSHWGPVPHPIHGSLGTPESITQMAYWSVQPFCRAHDRERHTDSPLYISNNRLRLHT